MATAKAQRRALRELEEAREELKTAKFMVKLWWVAVAVWVLINVGIVAAMALTGTWAASPILIFTIGFAGFALGLAAFEEYDGAFTILVRRQTAVRNATYAWEDTTLEDY